MLDTSVPAFLFIKKGYGKGNVCKLRQRSLKTEIRYNRRSLTIFVGLRNVLIVVRPCNVTVFST